MNLDANHCWDIMQRRDTAYDGVFFVGVRTTRIYCRPSCSARPLRKNIDFYPDSLTARNAGLRPCLRCHPDNILPETQLVHAITAYICALQNIPTLKELSAYVHFSPFYVNRVFKSQTGVTPRQYAAGIQRERLEELLRGKHERITDAILDAGYSTVGNAYYAQSFGMTLRDVRRGGDGWNIVFGIIPTEYGELCVAQTTRGVCRVFFVASLTDAQEQLKTTYPHASITHDQLNMQEVLETVRTLPHQTSPNAEIRIDIRATAFQHRVYDVLRRIPVGSTRTYKQIAEEVGNPRAARAVAQACAQNPLAVLIPCHRVVHSNRAREGYRWGIARKQSILDNEHQRVSTSNALMKEGEA